MSLKNSKKRLKNSIFQQCPLCHSGRIAFSLDAKGQYTLIKPPEETRRETRYNFFKCHQCHAEFLNPPPTQEELFDVFQDLYQAQLRQTQSKNKNGSFKKFLLRRRYRIITDQSSFLEKILFYPLLFTTIFQVRLIRKFLNGKKLRLLDIGCGPGRTIEIIRSYFPVEKALGIDFSENSVTLCRKKGIDARQADVGEIQEQYNLITVVHVLEHIPDPVKLLQNIEDRLEENGIVIMSLPNVKSLGRALFGENWTGFSTPKHVINYRKKTLFELFKHARLKIIHYSTRGFYLHSHRLFESSRFNFLHRFIDILPSPLFFNFGDEQTVIAVKGKNT